MKRTKLEIYSIDSEESSYIIHRYWDNANKNYEYQIHKLVQSKEVAREFGIPDITKKQRHQFEYSRNV